MTRREKSSGTNPVVSFVIGGFFRRLCTVLAELNLHSVLDAECGEGEMLRIRVLPAAVRPVCDLCPASLADAPVPHRVCASLLSLHFAARSLDAVTRPEGLEHLDDPAAVRKRARVARRTVVVSVPWEPSCRIRNVLRGKHLGRLGNHPEHVQHWNLRTFPAFLSGSVAEVRIVEAFPWIIACCRPNQL